MNAALLVFDKKAYALLNFGIARPGRQLPLMAEHDEAKVLSSVRAETALWCADGQAFTASPCGGEAIFHRILATRRSCPAMSGTWHPGRNKGHLKSRGRQGEYMG